jgi:uncharacterized protein (DUF58 family)
MRRVAGTALSVASMFLGLVAVLINAPALFYMSFALIATIIACNIQSNLATKALRIERLAPKSVHVGELVTVEIVLWSEQKIKRPLVTIQDQLPSRLAAAKVGISLPVAPAFDLPVRTMYQFRPTKRGRFRWKNTAVTATDALGLTTKTINYDTEATEVIVVPSPIPVNIELPSSAGWGINEAISGQAAGAGIEPRGIRPYSYGDSLRHVHWRTSARTGVLQVKEFQAGAQGSAAFLLQRQVGTDVGKGEVTSLDAMCGHALFLAEQLLRQGIDVQFPAMEDETGRRSEGERKEEIALTLGLIMADEPGSLGAELTKVLEGLGTGATVYVFVSIHDDTLTQAIQSARGNAQIVVLTYDAEQYDPVAGSVSAVRSNEIYRQAGAVVVTMPEVSV